MKMLLDVFTPFGPFDAFVLAMILSVAGVGLWLESLHYAEEM